MAGKMFWELYCLAFYISPSEGFSSKDNHTKDGFKESQLSLILQEMIHVLAQIYSSPLSKTEG